MAAKMLGPSIRGTHIHSTLPLGATSAVTSQSERKPYSAMAGNALSASSSSTEERSFWNPSSCIRETMRACCRLVIIQVDQLGFRYWRATSVRIRHEPPKMSQRGTAASAGRWWVHGGMQVADHAKRRSRSHSQRDTERQFSEIVSYLLRAADHAESNRSVAASIAADVCLSISRES